MQTHPKNGRSQPQQKINLAMKGIFFGCLVALPFALGAQHQIRAGYFGETITHYGFKFAYEYPLATATVTRPNGAVIRKQWLVGGGLGFFRHPHQQKGLILSPEITWRRTGRRGGLFDVAFSPAFFRYFYEGTTYEFTDNHFRRISLAGGNAFLPTISLGGGRDMSVQHGKSWMWFYRVHVMRQYPYNASALTRFALEVGIIQKL